MLAALLIAAASVPGRAQVASGVSSGPRANHAVGFYDATRERVVIVGGAEQPRAADRDRVWSWSGRRWELVTDSGPSARGNAAAAYDSERRMAVVAGGARLKADGAGFETMSDSWEGAYGSWQPITGSEI